MVGLLNVHTHNCDTLTVCFIFISVCSYQHSGKLAMLISLPKLILHSQSVAARGHFPHKQQMSLNYWYYLNFCKICFLVQPDLWGERHKPLHLNMQLVRVVCLCMKCLSMLLPEHKMGTGERLDLSRFFALLWSSQRFPFLISLCCVICANNASFLPVLFSGRLSISHQSWEVLG